MKKTNFILIIFILFIIGIIIYFYFLNFSKPDYNTKNNNSIQSNIQSNIFSLPSVPVETELASFSTVIKDNSTGRLTNIRLTCNAINGTIINAGETFSFNEIVGNPTPERGYQEAKVIINHHSENGIGGGNCQVSSTLYNAILSIPSLKVLERHEHGKDVTYVPEGKDAAVSYGSLDFKFRNNNNYKIKITITTDDKTIVASILKIE